MSLARISVPEPKAVPVFSMDTPLFNEIEARDQSPRPEQSILIGDKRVTDDFRQKPNSSHPEYQLIQRYAAAKTPQEHGLYDMPPSKRTLSSRLSGQATSTTVNRASNARGVLSVPQ